MSKFFAALPITNVLYNNFDSAIKLFSDLYLAKFLLQNHFFRVCYLEKHDFTNSSPCTQRTILLRDLKFCWIQKIILLLSK